MRFLLGWMFRLGFLGMAWFALTGDFQFQLPDAVLGYAVPQQAKQWVERAQIDEVTSGFNSIAGRLK
jgi:hypothetical protein